MSKKFKEVFYDYQLANDIDEHGLEAHPDHGFNNESDVINAMVKNLKGYDYGEMNIDVVIYRVEIIKTINVSIKNKKTIIIND